MRAELYILRRYLGFLAFLTVLAVMLYSAVFASVQDNSELSLSPWTVAGPLAVLAALWTVRRTEDLGERRALAMAPRSPLVIAGVVGSFAVLFQVLVAVPQPELTDRGRPVAIDSPVIAGLGGELLLRRGNRGLYYREDGAVVSVDLSTEALPAGFYPEPGRRAKLRRWLFFAWSPLWAGAHPLDPWLWRWLYVFWHGLAVLWVMIRRGAGLDLAVLLGAGLILVLL